MIKQSPSFLILFPNCLFPLLKKVAFFVLLIISTLTTKAQNSTTSDDSLQIIKLNQLSRKSYGFADSSRIYAQTALDLAKTIRSDRQQGDSYYSLAWYYYINSDLEQANVYADSAFQSFSEADFQSGIARCYNLRAIIMAEFKSIEEAHLWYKKAIEIYQAENNLNGVANIHNNLGALFNDVGRHKEALELHKKSHAHRHGSPDRVNHARSHHNLGLTYLGMEQYEDALINFDTAYQIRKAIQSENGMVETLIEIGSIARKVEEPNDKAFSQKLLSGLGFKNAYELFDSTLLLAQKIGSIGLISKIYHFQTEAFVEEGAFQKAYETQLIHQALLDSTRLNEQNLSSYINLKTRLENEMQQNKILLLEKNQTIKELKNQKRTRERNLLFGLVLLLITASLLGWLVLRQRLKSRKLQVELKQQELKELEQQQQINSMNAMMSGQEKERERISKDLHDGLGNLITSIKLQLGNIQNELPNLKQFPLFQSTYQLVEEAGKEARKVAHDMMPASLQRLGLVDALKELCRRQDQNPSTDYIFQALGEYQPLQKEKEISIYRICQELLQNINKHAEAKEVLLQITQTDQQILLSVEDDGKGFDINKINKSNSLGLRSLESRVQFLKGTLQIDSIPGEGTFINIEIPIN